MGRVRPSREARVSARENTVCAREKAVIAADPSNGLGGEKGPSPGVRHTARRVVGHMG